MIRLLVVFEYPTLNGGERSWLASLDDSRRAGFEVAAAAPSRGPLADELGRREVPIWPFDVFDESGGRHDLAALRDSLAQIVARHETQLLHANSLSTARLAGPVARELGVASLGHLRDILKLRAAAIADLNCHPRLLAVSQATRDFHVAQGLDAARVEVCHNGVDLEAFRPRDACGYLHEELKIPVAAPLVGSVGQVGLRKGFDVLLEAARRVLGEGAGGGSPGAAPHFLIVGARHSQKDESRQFEHDLHDAAAAPPLAGHVHFLGWRDDLPRLLPELTLLVHPARQEPLGRVLLEAAAAGCPMVAADVGGTREIFPQEAEAALLVPPDAPHELAAAITRLLRDPALRDRLATAARRRIGDAFDHRRAAAGLIEHYRQALAAKGCGESAPR
ncbi:MAG: glycosyltransferase family 1 protein [Planctomycetota bacterium]|nr:MAG: glycosyltransferase family 1 protein [Planctomycetota bacterium]